MKVVTADLRALSDSISETLLPHAAVQNVKTATVLDTPKESLARWPGRDPENRDLASSGPVRTVNPFASFGRSGGLLHFAPLQVSFPRSRKG